MLTLLLSVPLLKMSVPLLLSVMLVSLSLRHLLRFLLATVTVVAAAAIVAVAWRFQPSSLSLLLLSLPLLPHLYAT
jgi:hypothetical protein